MERPNDPVLDFIYNPSVRRLIMEGSQNWPWSRLSASRLSRVGYKLILFRCDEIGVTRPTTREAQEWMHGT